MGAGFGGLAAAKALADGPVHVTLMDRTNHHLFQPLLYQVATAALSPAQIAQPIRHILRRAGNISVVMEEATGIDLSTRKVSTLTGGRSYDWLILATGARHSYFGHAEWERHAPGLKSLDDALDIRRRILTAFERAEISDDPTKQARALTFAIIGAGPTGVEMAGSIAEMAHFAMKRDFRHINPALARILLVDAAPRPLPTFVEPLSKKALRYLQRLGVEVRLGAAVEDVTAEGIRLSGEFIPCGAVIWAAGNAASPLGKLLGAQTDRMGRVDVTPTLCLPEHPEVFVVGDLASFLQDAKPLPGVSPVAIQQGRHAAKNILAAIQGAPMTPFRYWDKGSMATIGRHAAVADLRGLRFGGFPAWLAWLFVHLIFLIGFPNRIMVLFQWMWSYCNAYRGARLITGRVESEK